MSLGRSPPRRPWRKPPVLANCRAHDVGRFGGPSTGSPAAWAAAGAAIRKLHDAASAPAPAGGRSIVAMAAELDDECELLVTTASCPLTW